MRCPARAIIGHLVWGWDGSVWAVYRGPSICYPHLPASEKLAHHSRFQSGLTVLPAESLLFSICREVGPAEVERRLTQGGELESHAAWMRFVEETMTILAGVPPVYERRNYLAMRLGEDGLRATWRALSTGISLFGQSFGVPTMPVPKSDIEARSRQAAELEAQLGGALALERVRAGELHWLYERVVHLGVDEPDFDPAWEPPRRTLHEGGEARVVGPPLAHLWDVVAKEGGDRTDEHRPRHRRYLRIECPDAQAFSYQTFLCVADMPRTFTFPGGLGEWFHHVDTAEFPVDWYAWVRAVPNELARAKSRRQARELAGQYEEYEGEPAGVPTELGEAHRGIDRERAELAADPNTPELEVTVAFSVWAADLTELELRAKRLQASFAAAQYRLARPTGGQEQLRASSLPGNGIPRVVRDYTQFLLPRDLAAGVPFTGGTVGDPQGMLVGCTLDAGTFQPVLVDPAYGPANLDRSGSMGVFGALGSGKSYFLKSLGWGALARGAQLVILDRTHQEQQEAEWVRFAQVAPGATQIVRLAEDAPISLDPFRIFQGDGRETYALGFLTLLTGVSALSREGIALAKAVEGVMKRPFAQIGDVLKELTEQAASNPHAEAVLDTLRYFGGTRFGRLVFGAGKPLMLGADCIVFDVPDLSLPSRDQLLHEHLFRQLPPEQLFNSALLYLLAAIMKQVIFRSPRRLGVAVFDEASFLTASPQGRELTLEIVRGGRKHAAVGWFASQHPDDMLDDPRLLALLGSRLVFRQSHDSAAAALRFAGIDEREPGAVELVTGHLGEGRCLLRDVRDRLGLVQMLPAPGADLREAFNTRPTIDHEQDEPGSERVATEEIAQPREPLAQRNGHQELVGPVKDTLE